MFSGFDWMEAIGSSPIFLSLVACSIVTVTVAAERALYFMRRRGNHDSLLQRTLERVRAGQAREAAIVCRESVLPLGPLAADLIEKGAQGDEAEERLMVGLSEQKLMLERNVSVLGSMAAIAPLIGLLGTVWGIMRAFQDMAATGSAAPSIVAAGVAEALTTTAAGLIVAVPAVLLFNHFTRRMNVMLTVSENHARTLRSTLNAEGIEPVGATSMTATAPQASAKVAGARAA
jgi:biopolymer transport protein ExbB